MLDVVVQRRVASTSRRTITRPRAGACAPDRRRGDAAFIQAYTRARQALTPALRGRARSSGLALDDAAVIAAAHKLINRLLFAAYCERPAVARLPQGVVAGLLTRARDDPDERGPWRALQEFFQRLAQGRSQAWPRWRAGVAGELYTHDPILDVLELPRRALYPDGAGGPLDFVTSSLPRERCVERLGAALERSLHELPDRARAVRGRGRAPASRRQRRGVYYTPRAIADYLVRGALSELLATADAPLRTLETLTLLDPACGAGALLCRAYERLHEARAALLDRAGAPRPSEPATRVGERLFGLDIMPSAVEFARLALRMHMAERSYSASALAARVRAGDSLRDGPPAPVDIVLCNPPWGAERSGWGDAALRARFPPCGDEKDSYALFLIRGYELLRPGGVLAYITPNSWLTVRGYASLRRWFLERFELRQLVNVWRVFPGVNHDACVVIARKRDAPSAAPSDPRPAMIASLARRGSPSAKRQQLATRQFTTRFTAAPAEWLRARDCRYETQYRPALRSALDTIAARGRPLASLCEITVGIQVYHRRKLSPDEIARRVFHADHRVDARWHPYVTGSQVQRYCTRPRPGAYLMYSDRLCDKRPLAHYGAPRILIQQMFWGRLAAALQEPPAPLLYLNTLFSCSAASVPLGMILAVLNSRLASAAYERWANRLFGEKFPKLSKLDLARFPMPRCDRALARRLHLAALELRAAWAALAATEGPQGQERDALVQRRWSAIETLERRVEDGVQDAYQIDDQLRVELLERAPAIALEDALRSRGRAKPSVRGRASSSSASR